MLSVGVSKNDADLRFKKCSHHGYLSLKTRTFKKLLTSLCFICLMFLNKNGGYTKLPNYILNKYVTKPVNPIQLHNFFLSSWNRKFWENSQVGTMFCFVIFLFYFFLFGAHRVVFRIDSCFLLRHHSWWVGLGRLYTMLKLNTDQLHTRLKLFLKNNLVAFRAIAQWVCYSRPRIHIVF